jgi:hypothetical protein
LGTFATLGQFLNTALLQKTGSHHQSLLLSILWRKQRTMTRTTFKLAGLRCTYYKTNRGNDMSFQVVLPNGRKVELYSKKGADEFVDTVGTDFISSTLTATDDQKLKYAYMLLFTAIDFASPDKVSAGFPESELRTLVDHTRNTLDTLSTDRNWLRSGTVSICHQLLLQNVACFLGHPSFVKIFLSNEGMEAVAKFCASRKKNDTPTECVAQLILTLVNGALCLLTKEGLNNEKAFYTIEKTGLLGQFIRCVPVDPERFAGIVECLQTCLQLVKKKLKSGTPTGDILDSVIAGKDGPINEKAKSGLVRLQSLARLSNAKDNYNNECADTKTCCYCNKLETQLDNAMLMKCQRCKVTYYCSKECQVADWKSHKKVCKVISSGIVSPSTYKNTVKTHNLTMWAFIKLNYFDIAKEVHKKSQEYNVPKKELLVEIDFYGDAPALRNEFKVWLTSGFLEGSSVADAPGWFRMFSESSKTIAQDLREEYEEVKSNDLLVVCRACNKLVTFKSLDFMVANTGHQLLSDEAVEFRLLSDEAVESIGREDYDRMVAYLGQSITNRYFEKRSGLE